MGDTRYLGHPATRTPLGDPRMENRRAEKLIDSAHHATRRCGICDDPLGDRPSVIVDDECCHVDCAAGEPLAHHCTEPGCPWCQDGRPR